MTPTAYHIELANRFQVDPADVATLAQTLGPAEDHDALPLYVGILAAMNRTTEATR